MAHQVFEKTIRIHFGDCDPAGIVYHPTYYVLLNKFHEDYLHEVLKVGFIEIRRFGVGFPVVGVHTDFVSPSRPGEDVTARLWIEKLGTSGCAAWKRWSASVSIRKGTSFPLPSPTRSASA